MLDELVDVDVDMNVAPRCELSEHATQPDQHEGDAAYFIEAVGHCEDRRERFLACAKVYEAARLWGCVECNVCGVWVPLDEHWRIVSVL